MKPTTKDPVLSSIGLKGRRDRILGPLAGLFPALAAGFLVCVIVALLAGAGPFDVITAILDGAWGSEDAAATTLSKLTPLLLTGLAVSMAYQAKLLNIGCEGQLTVGALASAGFAASAVNLPAFILIPLTAALGAFAGALWSYPGIWLKQRRGVHEVITTIFMNYLAVYLCDFLVLGPMGDGTAMGRTPEIAPGAVWPLLWRYGASGVTAAPFFALFLSLIAQVWLTRTYWGFEARAAGSGPKSAGAAGIAVDSWQRRMFIVSGALAGLAGALEVVAVHHRFYRSFSPGYGFDGITAAFLVNISPGWIWLSGLLLAGMRTADKWLQVMLGISPSSIYVIQAILLLAVASQQGFKSGLAHVMSLFQRPFTETARKERE